MIGIIATPRHKILFEEFVEPILEIVEKVGHVGKIIKLENLNKINLEKYEAFIISGTALKDFSYLKYLRDFKRLLNKPIFGICAGGQILALLHGGYLINKHIIGKKRIKFINERKYTYAYFLTSKIPLFSLNKIEVFAVYKSIPVFFKIKNTSSYISVFHPEVYNHDLLYKFLDNIK